MLKKFDGVGFQSTLLLRLDGVVHGFSSRQAGDMSQEIENRKRFAHTLGFNASPVFAQQTHSNTVPGDGLVSRDTPVAVVTADCVPVLLVDPVGRVCGAVHAGWKGTLGGVVGNAVGEMVKIGAFARRICAALGPHIGMCCYDVPEERASVFIERFGSDEKMVFMVDGVWHLDIGWANYRQLIEAGLLPDHIDAPPTCTSCQNSEFFSYRKDSKETYGEMMAVIGFDNNHNCVVETGLKPVSTNMNANVNAKTGLKPVSTKKTTKTEQTKFRGKYRIESTRLKNYDYSSDGAYFITICTKNREHYFGEIINVKLQETEQSKICMACWLDLPNYYASCVLDEFVIMPNHVHGIIFIQNHDKFPVETGLKPVSTNMKPKRYSISEIIRGFKTFTARKINIFQNTQGTSFWQSRFYDHIIRNEDQLNRIREYIQYNPIHWDKDRNNFVETGFKPVSTISRSKRIYFVGIKGVAMAALAIWAKEAGIIVAGSDVAEEFPTDEELKKAKIDIHEGFEQAHLVAFKPDLVIYTGAHGGRENPQVVYAKKHAIPSLPHGQALGLAMKGKRQISVAGSHGKTTTAAMIATILTEAALDPSYAIGCGLIRGLGAGGHSGKGDWFVAEADEYVTDPGHDPTPRFLWQKPEVLVVTNIDYDHPDVYPDLSTIQQSFVKLQKQSKFTFVSADDEASSVLKRAGNVVTFGLSEKLNELKLQIPGRHNMFNAAAAAAVCERIGISWETIKRGLARFGGTKRRFEKLGKLRGALIYDDYAHHPKEIEATIAAFRDKYPKKRLIVVFQPHTYSRTISLKDDFIRALSLADITLVTNIYASARETQKDEGLAKQLAHLYTPTRKEVSEWLQKELCEDDVVVFMGAGDIYQWARSIV